MIQDIVLIGAGQVAHHLGQRLRQCGLHIVQVYSRSRPRADELAGLLGTIATADLEAIVPTADCYLLAVRDDAIAEVAAALVAVLPELALLAHTSGATPATILPPYFRNAGVFYPLQTFSRQRSVDFSQVPICCFAREATATEALMALARRISSSVHHIDDEARARLHVAAVFVNNFTNYLYQVGYQLLREEGLPFDLLRPLILETAAKVQDQAPVAVQTGPAARSDHSTEARHLRQLEAYPAWAELYRLLSDGIRRAQERKG